MRVWAVANQKGGVGKTTSSIALAGLLAEAGKRVVVVDLDPHGSMTSYFGYDPDSLEHSSYDLFLHKGSVPQGLPGQLLMPTSDERISLLPSSTALATLERQSPGQSGLGLVIAKSLAQLWQDFDYAVIDSPPLLGVLMVNALAASQQLVIPCRPASGRQGGRMVSPQRPHCCGGRCRSALCRPFSTVVPRRPSAPFACCATSTRKKSGKATSRSTPACVMRAGQG